MYGGYSEALIGQIYDAALDSGRWPDVIEAICRETGFRAGVLIQVQTHGFQAGALGLYGVDPQAAALIPRYFSDPRENPYAPHIPFFREGDIIWRQMLMDDETFDSRGIHTEFFQPQDLYHDMTAALSIHPDEAVGLFVSRARREGQAEEGEVQALQCWMPHLRRAMRIRRELGLRETGALVLDAVLERVACGVVLVRADGRAVTANRAAERILAAADGLAFRQGSLAAQQRHDSARLEAAVAAAVQGGGSGALTVERPSGARAYQVFTMPLSSAHAAGWPGSPVALVMLVDPETIEAPPARILAELYGLSPTEATVALAIIGGEGRPAVAAGLGIGTNTVKTHLAQVFAKTGTGSQVELARLLGANGVLWKGAGE